MKYFTLISLLFLPLAATCPTASGQAAVEYGLGAGRAATTAAPALDLGKGIRGVFDTLNKTIEPDKGMTSSSTAAPGSSSAKPQRPARSKQSTGLAAKKATLAGATTAAAVYEDPRQLRAGIGYDEMVRRFGPPSMSITAEAGRSAVSYSGAGGLVQVEVVDGKVISVAGAQSE